MKRYARKLWIEDSLRKVAYLPPELGEKREDTPIRTVHTTARITSSLCSTSMRSPLRGCRMLAGVSEAEVQDYLEAARGQRDEQPCSGCPQRLCKK